MRNQGLIKTHTADGAVGAYRIVVHGAADGNAAQAAGSTVMLMGVTDRLGAAVAGDRIDVVRSGIAEVEFGGTVARGDPLTSDASGRAVAAAPAAGANAYVIGFAEVSGVLGDIGSASILPGRIQG